MGLGSQYVMAGGQGMTVSSRQAPSFLGMQLLHAQGAWGVSLPVGLGCVLCGDTVLE